MRKTIFSRYMTDQEAGVNLSWASVFAGMVTFVSVFMLFSLIGSAIGFGMVKATESDPLAGVGTGVLIWSGVTLVISLFAAGYVAGLASRRAGLLHGFLTWAVSLIVCAYLLTSAVIGAFSVAGSAISSVMGGAASVVSTVGEGAVNLVGEGVNAAVENINVDTEKLFKDSKDVLRDTEVKELQPEYLQDQLAETKDEVVQALKDMAVNPSNAGETLNNVLTNLQDRVETIAQNVDRDAISKAVAKNTELSEEEAQKMTDNAYNAIMEAQAQAKEQIENLQASVEEAKVKVDQLVEDAKVAADNAAKTASQASIILFVSLVLGLVLTSFAGYLGSASARKYITVEK